MNGIPVIVLAWLTSMVLLEDVVAVSPKTRRVGQLLASGMVVVVEFGVVGSEGMSLHKISKFRFCFAAVIVPE